jgi:DNA repair exonuclease SbcCD ATPase subunit
MPTAGKILAVVAVVLSVVFLYFAASVLELRHNQAQMLQALQSDIAQLRARIARAKEGVPEQVQKFEELRQQLDAAVRQYMTSPAHEQLQGALKKWADVVQNPEGVPPQEVQDLQRQIDQLQGELASRFAEMETAFRAFLSEMPRLARFAEGLGTNQLTLWRESLYAARAAVQRWSSTQQIVYDALRTFYENQNAAFRTQELRLQEQSREAQAELDRLAEQLRPRALVTVSEAQLRSQLADHPVVQLTAQDLRQMPESRLREILRGDEPGVPGLAFAHHLQALVEMTEADLAELQALLAERQEELQKATADRGRFLKENKTLVARLASLETQLDAKEGKPVFVLDEQGHVPEGQIVSVDPQTFEVSINVGLRDGIRPGVKLYAYRLQPDPKYLGLIEVKRVETERSTAVILPAYRDVVFRVGDRVAPIVVPRP